MHLAGGSYPLRSGLRGIELQCQPRDDPFTPDRTCCNKLCLDHIMCEKIT